MQILRASILRHRHLAAALIVLALCVRALIPAGFMVSPSSNMVLEVSICADSTGGDKTMRMVIPANPERVQHQGSPVSAKSDGACAFSGLAHAALAGADAVLLVAALAFIVVLGLAPARQVPTARARHLRPPLRGPPAIA